MSRSVPELEGHVLMLILLFRGVTLQNLGLRLDLGNWNLEDRGSTWQKLESNGSGLRGL